MIPRKLKLAVARFPYAGNGGSQAERPEVGDWLWNLSRITLRDERIEEHVLLPRLADTPITMTRNQIVRTCKQAGVDVLVMIDSDQIPNLMVGIDPRAKFWFNSSFDFLSQHYDRGPCIVLAPYCGPPPAPGRLGEEMVYIFYWKTDRENPATRRYSLEAFTRHEAAQMAGISKVAAGPTGLCMIDLRVFDHPDLKIPWFDYEWEDKYACQKASTEDVYFTRNVSLLGMPVYCNWDAWAGHAKGEIVGKPTIMTVEQVGQEFAAWARKGIHADECIMDVDFTRGNGNGHVLHEAEIDVEAFMRPEKGVIPEPELCPTNHEPTPLEPSEIS